MRKVLQRLEKELVHPNHYALLPLKTAIVATTYTLLKNIPSAEPLWKELLQDFLQRVRELLEVVEVLLPGMTSERGLLLFYLAEGMRLSLLEGAKLGCGGGPVLQEMKNRMKLLQDEALKIMRLDPEDDDQRKLVEANLSIHAS
jgi:hypothetical protein